MPDIKPILFNTEMVRAILEGRKTQTRRLIKPQPQNVTATPYWDDEDDSLVIFPCEENGQHCEEAYSSPYKPGDILWVRESFCPNYLMTHPAPLTV